MGSGGKHPLYQLALLHRGKGRRGGRKEEQITSHVTPGHCPTSHPLKRYKLALSKGETSRKLERLSSNKGVLPSVAASLTGTTEKCPIGRRLWYVCSSKVCHQRRAKAIRDQRQRVKVVLQGPLLSERRRDTERESQPTLTRIWSGAKLWSFSHQTHRLCTGCIEIMGADRYAPTLLHCVETAQYLEED